MYGLGLLTWSVELLPSETCCAVAMVVMVLPICASRKGIDSTNTTMNATGDAVDRDGGDGPTAMTSVKRAEQRIETWMVYTGCRLGGVKW